MDLTVPNAVRREATNYPKCENLVASDDIASLASHCRELHGVRKPLYRELPRGRRCTASSLLLKVAVLAGGPLLLPLGASAQKISSGIVAGGSLTDGFRDLTRYYFSPVSGGPARLEAWRSWSPSKDYVIGAMLEVRLNPHWSLEVNGLFRQLHGKTGPISLPDLSQADVFPNPVVTWQFPVLAKYRFEGRKINPFFAAGPSFRTTGNLNNSSPSHHGIAAASGAEMNWRNLKITPTVRYTLWAADKRPDTAQTATDQVELLLGFSRASESDWHPLGRNISLGVTLGTNLTGDFRTSHSNLEPVPGVGEPQFWPVASVAFSPRSFIYGPTVEVRLPNRFSLQVDALNRPIMSRATELVYADGRRVRSTYRAGTWVFPVLAKYRFSLRGWEPFIALGPTFRTRQGHTDSAPFGVTAALGVEVHVRPIRIAPAMRYTHWARADGGGPFRNQAEALVGFSF
jgi:hypothetical protein